MTQPETPDTTNDDADVAAFAEEYDGLRSTVAEHDQRLAEHEEKMSAIEELSAKFDAFLKGNVGGSGTSKQSTTARGGTQATRTPQGQPQPSQGTDVSGSVGVEKKPKAQHWYFRDAPWKRQ